MIAKDVTKNKMNVVAGQINCENEKELDESQQIITKNEIYIGDDKIENDVFNRVLQNREIQSENDDVFSKKSIERFIRILHSNNRELQLQLQ